MPVKFQLEENQRIMLWELSDPLALPELTTYYTEAQHILNHANHSIHSLVDVRHMHGMPSGVLKARFVSTWNHPHSGYTLIVGGTLMVMRMLEVIFTLSKFERLKFFPTEPEARAYLRELIDAEVASGHN